MRREGANLFPHIIRMGRKIYLIVLRVWSWLVGRFVGPPPEVDPPPVASSGRPLLAESKDEEDPPPLRPEPVCSVVAAQERTLIRLGRTEFFRGGTDADKQARFM